jgi:hypothetical protein
MTQAVSLHTRGGDRKGILQMPSESPTPITFHRFLSFVV